MATAAQKACFADMDCGFERPTWPLFAVKVFALFDEVLPQGGGTLLLSGSHRLVERYSARLPPGTAEGTSNWARFMKHDPWLHKLYRGGNESDDGRGMIGATREIDGIPVEVVEFSGQPGDVVIAHLHVFHSVSPNTRPRPRHMLSAALAARED